MTSREWRGDRRAVFERDEYTCRHCGTAGGDGKETSVSVRPIGDVSLEEPIHESALVTVCERCLEVSRGSKTRSEPAADREGLFRADRNLFRLVRETARGQGAAVSDVAAFASLGTSLPAELEDGDDPGREYAAARRELRLSLAVVDGRLAAVESVALEVDDRRERESNARAAFETDAGDPDVASLLTAFTGTARELQSALRAVVTCVETVVVGLERCHGCFEPVQASGETESGDGEPCPTCGLEPHGTADWRREDGTFAFESRFSTITDRLEGASATTEELTDRTTALGEALVHEEREL